MSGEYYHSDEEGSEENKEYDIRAGSVLHGTVQVPLLLLLGGGLITGATVHVMAWSSVMILVVVLAQSSDINIYYITPASQSPLRSIRKHSYQNTQSASGIQV